MLQKAIGVLSLLAILSPAQAKISIFACEPEWAALAKEIGGELVNTYSATTAKQDPHLIEARPSLLAKSRKADLLFCTGAGLELGWLPILLKKTGNPRIQPGKPGHLMATDHVKLLEVLGEVKRGMGDIHAGGNPHIHLDPRNLLPVAKELTARLAAIAPDKSDIFETRLTAFQDRWKQALGKWKKESASLSGTPIVVHHRSWIYLQNWLGLREVAALEPKPGVPPTSTHLAKVVTLMEIQPAKVIIRSPYQDPKPSKWLQKKTGVTAVMLPFTVGGTAESANLFGLYEDTIARLKKAVR